MPQQTNHNRDNRRQPAATRQKSQFTAIFLEKQCKIHIKTNFFLVFSKKRLHFFIFSKSCINFALPKEKQQQNVTFGKKHLCKTADSLQHRSCIPRSKKTKQQYESRNNT